MRSPARRMNPSVSFAVSPSVSLAALALIGYAPLVQATPAAVEAREVEKRLDEKRMTAHMRHLSSAIGARREGSPQERRAAHYVAGWLGRWGYDVRFESVRLPDGSRSQNVIADRLTGVTGLNRIAGRERRYFVIGAHYDSRTGTPGANDNASGVAVLLELARVLADVADTAQPAVRFIAFGAEERWERRYQANAHRLNGSNQHVARLTAVERRRIRGMVSLDMVGVGNVLQIGVLPGSESGSRHLAATLLKEARSLGVRAESFQTPPWSDHVAFARAGIPAVWMWWYPDRLFHTPRDVPSRVSAAKMRAAARVALRAVLAEQDQ